MNKITDMLNWHKRLEEIASYENVIKSPEDFKRGLLSGFASELITSVEVIAVVIALTPILLPLKFLLSGGV